MRGLHVTRDAPPAGWPFVGASMLVHVLLLLLLRASVAPLPAFELKVPEAVEVGLADDDPGPEGSPAPAATPAPEPEPVAQPEPEPEPEPDVEPAAQDVTVVMDAGVRPKPDAMVAVDEHRLDGGLHPASQSAGRDEQLAVGTTGTGRGGVGAGLGFGAGGFGLGRGGPLGAVIGLHANLDAIRKTSLILETHALLEIIPQWRSVLAGSGLEPVEDFSRLFIATPTLDRSHLVLSGTPRQGGTQIRDAAQHLTRAAGKQASTTGATIPWNARGATVRVAHVFDDGQVVIARPEDVSRAASVGAALAQRHARQPGMERRQGHAALLAMYEGEAVALSVEGVQTYVGDQVDFAPKGIRLSLRHLDEFHATLVAYGYYDSEAAATAAQGEVDALRIAWIDHPRARYLGLQSALAAARVSREGDTLVLKAKLTMHQMRYLLGYVSRALNPR